MPARSRWRQLRGRGSGKVSSCLKSCSRYSGLKLRISLKRYIRDVTLHTRLWAGPRLRPCQSDILGICAAAPGYRRPCPDTRRTHTRWTNAHRLDNRTHVGVTRPLLVQPPYPTPTPVPNSNGYHAQHSEQHPRIPRTAPFGATTSPPAHSAAAAASHPHCRSRYEPRPCPPHRRSRPRCPSRTWGAGRCPRQ